MRRLNVVTRLIQREPVAFQGCVQASLAALVGFGVVNWSNEQVGLMLAVVAAFLALYTRAVVSPTSMAVAPGHDAVSADPHADVPAGSAESAPILRR
jgi:type IV secretory pathway TrbD component